jgi:hypothetical protein
MILHGVDSQTKRLSGASAIARGRGRWLVDGSRCAFAGGSLLRVMTGDATSHDQRAGRGKSNAIALTGLFGAAILVWLRFKRPRGFTPRPSKPVPQDFWRNVMIPGRLALFTASMLLSLSAFAASCNNCGSVAEVREVHVKGEGSGLGAVAGGVVGGLLGNQVGGGRGQDRGHRGWRCGWRLRRPSGGKEGQGTNRVSGRGAHGQRQDRQIKFTRSRAFTPATGVRIDNGVAQADWVVSGGIAIGFRSRQGVTRQWLILCLHLPLNPPLRAQLRRFGRVRADRTLRA